MMSSFTLSLAAVDILWESQDLGQLVYPFDIPHNGITGEERAAIRAAVFADLTRCGLARDGRVDPDVELALRVLAGRQVAISLVGVEGERSLSALAASTGRAAVLAVQEGTSLWLERIRPTGLVSAILGLLLDEKAGTGQSVVLTDTPGAHQPQRQVAESYLKRPRNRLGQLGVCDARTTLFELNWFDTDLGRYVSYSRQAQDGVTWITYAPANKSRLQHLLTEALT